MREGQKKGQRAARAEKEPDGLRGSAPKVLPLSSVRKNSWNPTGITAAERERIKHGFETDGWVRSQSLLVWGLDEKGARRNVIIDGEQKHTVALELGWERGPMVFLDGLTEAQARALTIKMNARRAGGGGFDMARLTQNIGVLKAELSIPDLAYDLGLDKALFERLEKANTPPPDFREFSENIATTYCCPKCGFKWDKKAR